MPSLHPIVPALDVASWVDGAVTAGRLAAVAARLAWARFAGSGDAPATIADLDPLWLTRALQRAFPGCRVEAVEALSRHVGTTARARLRLTYRDPGRGGPPPPTLFAKLAPTDPRTRLFVNLLRLGATEVRFYRDVAADVPGELPRVYHAATGRADGFALLLEDLEGRGARFLDVARPPTVDEAHLVMRALARLHAAFWESPRFRGDLAWLKARDRNPLYRVERFVCARAVPVGLARLAAHVPPALHAAAPRILAARDVLEDSWAEGPLTLIHGDAHAGNLYFLPAAVGFLDWQVAQRGQGMRDVSYFLANSLPAEARREHETALIAGYLAALAEHGVTPPAFERAWQQHRLHVVYAWIGAAVTGAAMTLQEEPIVRAAIARTSTALLDLDALGAMRDL